MDPCSGKIIDGVNIHAKVYPASLTKMMTLFILFEEMEKKRISLTTRFTVSQRACDQPPGKLWVKKGQTISVLQCILALAVRSSNDIAVVVAENVSKGFNPFVNRMNATAQRLNMTRTKFKNPSGWHHPQQYTTACDISRLTRALWSRFPQYRHLLNRPYFIYRDTQYSNTNRLCQFLRGIQLSKTGYTCPAGFNLAMVTERHNRPVIAVVMGMTSARQRDHHMTRIIEAFYKAPTILTALLRDPLYSTRSLYRQVKRKSIPSRRNNMRRS
jgi:D-alanyl-D-alanine carboxypeptidase